MKVHSHTLPKRLFEQLMEDRPIGSEKVRPYGPPWDPFEAGDVLIMHEVDGAAVTGRLAEFDILEVGPWDEWDRGQLAKVRRRV